MLRGNCGEPWISTLWRVTADKRGYEEKLTVALSKEQIELYCHFLNIQWCFNDSNLYDKK